MVGCFHGSICISENSDFLYTEGRGITVFNSSSAIITKSKFIGHSVMNEGAAIFLRQPSQTESHVLQTHAKFATIFSQHQVDMKNPNLRFAPSWEITKCTFVENSAGSGGAIASVNGSLHLAGNHFVNNSAIGSPANAEGNGGAVWLSQSPSNVTGCTFDRNKALFGGAISSLGKLLSIVTSNFVRNEAVGSKLTEGGAIFIFMSQTGKLYVVNSTFYCNKASHVGGAIRVSFTGAQTSISQSNFQGNSAALGGAVLPFSGNITFCHFYGNSAQLQGGALLIEPHTQMKVLLCNFTNNTALSGGAIGAGVNTNISFKKCIFRKNTAVSR